MRALQNEAPMDSRSRTGRRRRTGCPWGTGSGAVTGLAWRGDKCRRLLLAAVAGAAGDGCGSFAGLLARDGELGKVFGVDVLGHADHAARGVLHGIRVGGKVIAMGLRILSVAEPALHTKRLLKSSHCLDNVCIRGEDFEVLGGEGSALASRPTWTSWWRASGGRLGEQKGRGAQAERGSQVDGSQSHPETSLEMYVHVYEGGGGDVKFERFEQGHLTYTQPKVRGLLTFNRRCRLRGHRCRERWRGSAGGPARRAGFRGCARRWRIRPAPRIA
jgi:hypothetical protein